MYVGEYEHNLDSKGRLIIPSKFREELDETFYITRGLGQCLYIYSVEQMKVILTRLSKLPATKAAVRDYTRILTSSTSECSFDTQGRILIPAKMLKRVGITKACSIVGSIDHIEIWDKDTWETYYDEKEDNFEAAAEEITDLYDGTL